MRSSTAKLSDKEKATLYPDDAKQGMGEMSEKLKAVGSEVYVDQQKAVKGSNKAL